MESWMMKRAFCERCGADMGMMIQDDAPHPTCFACLDRALSPESVTKGLIRYFGSLILIGIGLAFLLFM
jgi:hypothetical protein